MRNVPSIAGLGALCAAFALAAPATVIAAVPVAAAAAEPATPATPSPDGASPPRPRMCFAAHGCPEAKRVAICYALLRWGAGRSRCPSEPAHARYAAPWSGIAAGQPPPAPSRPTGQR